MRKRTKQRGLSILLTLAMALGCISVPGRTAQAASNVANGKTVTTSSVEAAVASNTGDKAVDGSTDTRWSSEKMKETGATDESAQTAQWLVIDLGAKETKVTEIKVHFYMKVWATSYKIETADTNTDNTQWQTLKTISRASGSQNDGPVDTFTDISTLKRYVRFYFEKINVQAAGTGVSVTEIEINGTQSGAVQVDSAKGALNAISIDSPGIDDAQITIPQITAGYDVAVVGSDKENIISNDGKIVSHNIGDQKVTLLVEAKSKTNAQDKARKNFTVTVPSKNSKYPDLFTTVASPNKEPEVIPSLQEWYGYEGEFTLTDESKIVINDAANVNLKDVAEQMKTDLEEISGKTLSVETGTSAGANDIYIESLKQDTYEVGKEGYFMVTDENGIKIYAPSYKGCLYGTVTVEQILWQDDDGNDTVPRGVIRDYPDYEIRGIMFDVGRIPHRLQYLKDYAKILKWYKMSEYQLHLNDDFNYSADASPINRNLWTGMHRLESDAFPSLTNKRVYGGAGSEYEEQFKYFNEEYADPVYTKEEYIELENLSRTMGVELIPEFDTPSHSTAYIEYANQNPDHISWLKPMGANNQCLQLDRDSTNAATREKGETSFKFMEELYKDYLEDPDGAGPKTPVFNNSTVNVGMDEYWDKSNPEAFFDYMKFITDLVSSYGKTVRMWGEAGSFLSSSSNSMKEMPQEILALKDKVVFDEWATSSDDPIARMKEGFRVVNIPQMYLYTTPGRDHKDMVVEEWLFKNWTPMMFSGGSPADTGEPLLLGAKATVWGDEFREGIVEADTHERMLRSVAITAEKTWGGTNADDEYVDYQQTFDKLKEGPGTQLAHEIDSMTETVAEYDLSNAKEDNGSIIIKDTSGNGYDAEVKNGSLKEVEGKTMVEFNGSTLMTTPLQTLDYPYTISFDVKASSGNTGDAILFSGYDGQLRAADKNGTVTLKRSFFTQPSGYTIPTDKTVNMTIVGTFQNTKIYVDGVLVKMFFSSDSNQAEEWWTTFVFPMEEIGKNFHGYIGNIRAYNKAMQPEMLKAAGETVTEVNVALNKNAYAERFGNAPQLNSGDLKRHPSWKATDGDRQDTSVQITSTDPNSYWLSSNNNEDYLMVDLGIETEVKKVVIYWQTNQLASAFNIQVSSDRKNWQTVGQQSGNTAEVSTVEFSPVKARYVKMQGVTRAGNYYGVREMEVYQSVNKSALKAAWQEELAYIADKKIEEDTSVQAQALLQQTDAAAAALSSPVTSQELADSIIAELAKKQEAYEKSKEEPVEPVDPVDPVDPNPPVETKLPYKDVAENAWFKSYVTDVYQKGLMTGKSKDVFAPDENLARAQFATILHRMNDEPKVSYSARFTDVFSGDWYMKAVLWAASDKVKIVTGYSDGRFGPNDNITREQMALMMYRYAKYKGYDVKDKTDISSFPDAGAVSSYAKDAMEWCVAKGIISGQGGQGEVKRLNPQGSTTRAECATIISRFSKAYK